MTIFISRMSSHRSNENGDRNNLNNRIPPYGLSLTNEEDRILASFWSLYFPQEDLTISNKSPVIACFANFFKSNDSHGIFSSSSSKYQRKRPHQSNDIPYEDSDDEDDTDNNDGNRLNYNIVSIAIPSNDDDENRENNNSNNRSAKGNHPSIGNQENNYIQHKQYIYNLDYNLFVSKFKVTDFPRVLADQCIDTLNCLSLGLSIVRNVPCLIKFIHLPNTTMISDIRSNTVSKLIQVSGTVSKCSSIKTMITSCLFECSKCHGLSKVFFHDGFFEYPEKCTATKGCRCKYNFLLKRETCQSTDLQIIKVMDVLDNQSNSNSSSNVNSNEKSETDQDSRTDLGAGRLPSSIEVELIGADMVNTCIPGDNVKIVGVVDSRNDNGGTIYGKSQGQVTNSLYVMYVKAISIVNQRKTLMMNELNFSTNNMTGIKHLLAIKDIASQSNTFELLVHSLCPQIYGHELVKAGLILALFSGSMNVNEQSVNRSQNFEADTKPKTSNLNEESNDNDQKSHENDRQQMDIEESGDLISKTNNNDQNNINNSKRNIIQRRFNPHILVVGDPGLGKSRLLRAVTNLSPRGVYICGNTSTATGLTVTVTNERNSNENGLEAGALILSDQGICCIDEFDKISSNHYSSLLEAMEQQRISVAKAGVVATLSSRCSIIAAANPVGGKYNHCKTLLENIKISNALFTRFDLIFIVCDNPLSSGIDDAEVSNHILKRYRTDYENYNSRNINRQHHNTNKPSFMNQNDRNNLNSSSSFSVNRQHVTLKERLASSKAKNAKFSTIPAPLLKQYICYARKYCNPILTKEAGELLQETYLRKRKANRFGNYHGYNSSSKTGSKQTSVPITLRHLESLIRLSQARAKCELRTYVTKQDAIDVIQLMEESMAEVNSDDTMILQHAFSTSASYEKNNASFGNNDDFAPSFNHHNTNTSKDTDCSNLHHTIASSTSTSRGNSISQILNEPITIPKSGVISKAKQIKVFIKHLTKLSIHNGNKLYHRKELLDIALGLGLAIENFDNFIDILNTDCYLLKKGADVFQFMAT